MRNQNIRYIDAHVSVDGHPIIEAWTTCPFCNNSHRGYSVFIDNPAYLLALERIADSCIQEVFTDDFIENNLFGFNDPASVREFHISGICNDCWTEMTRLEEFGDEFVDDEFTDEEYESEDIEWDENGEPYVLRPLAECFPFR